MPPKHWQGKQKQEEMTKEKRTGDPLGRLETLCFERISAGCAVLPSSLLLWIGRNSLVNMSSVIATSLRGCIARSPLSLPLSIS